MGNGANDRQSTCLASGHNQKLVSDGESVKSLQDLGEYSKSEKPRHILNPVCCQNVLWRGTKGIWEALSKPVFEDKDSGGLDCHTDPKRYLTGWSK